MVDLNVLSEVGGFKLYLAKDTLGLVGVLKHPKHPPKYAPGASHIDHDKVKVMTYNQEFIK